jgi:hypothetical protein
MFHRHLLGNFTPCAGIELSVGQVHPEGWSRFRPLYYDTEDSVTNVCGGFEYCTLMSSFLHMVLTSKLLPCPGGACGCTFWEMMARRICARRRDQLLPPEAHSTSNFPSSYEFRNPSDYPYRTQCRAPRAPTRALRTKTQWSRRESHASWTAAGRERRGATLILLPLRVVSVSHAHRHPPTARTMPATGRRATRNKGLAGAVRGLSTHLRIGQLHILMAQARKRPMTRARAPRGAFNMVGAGPRAAILALVKLFSVLRRHWA